MSVRALEILKRRQGDLGVWLVILGLVLVISVSFPDYAIAQSRLIQTDHTNDEIHTSTHVDDRSAQTLLTESIQVLGGARIPVARWYGPVRLAVIGANEVVLNSQILPIFSKISLLSGIRFRVIKHHFETADEYAKSLSTTPPYDFSLCDKTEPQYCANFVVIISERGSIRDIAMSLPLRPVFQQATLRAKDTLCFFSPGITRDREIVRSLVYVPVELEPNMKLTCLQEEIYQSFGLFGDYTDSNYFSFNNRVEPKSITRYDKWLLTSLYDRSFTKTAVSTPVVQQLVEYFRHAAPLVK